MAIAPSKLGQFVLRRIGDGDDALVHSLRAAGLVRPDARDDELTAAFRRARQEHEALPEDDRAFNSPEERIRVFLGPYLSTRGLKWAEPLESLDLPDEEQSPDPPDRKRPYTVPGRRSQQATWLFAAAALALFLLLALAVYQHSPPYFGWDVAASQAVQSARWPGLETLMRVVSLAGDHVLGSGALVAAACLVLLAVGARREALALLGVVLAGQVLKIGVKHLVGRPRPSPDLVRVLTDAKEVYSFPSGHTVHYLVFFGFLWFLAFTLLRPPARRRALLAGCGTLVLLVGPARIYLGAHWLSDVVGGYLLGGAVLAVGIGVYRRRPGPALPDAGNAERVRV